MTSIHWSTVMRPARDDVADLLVEDLGRGAGQRAEPGLLQLAQVLLDRQPERASTPYSTSSGEKAWRCMLGQRRLDRAAEIDVEAAVELGRQPGLDADLGGAQLPGLLRAAHHLVDGQEVALLLAVVAAEGAEAAVLDADVGEVDVAVDDVGDDVARLPAAQLVGDEA